MVVEESFREDLLYRINTIQISLPPLRERKTDITLLLDFFKKKYENKYKKPEFIIPELAKEKLLKHDWPGNIRELQHLVEKAVILSDDNYLNESDFGLDQNLESVGNKHETLDLMENEKKLIMKARKSFHKTSAISKFQLLKLQTVVDNYGLEKTIEELETAEIASLFDDLMKRVEIVPVRLTLAQAIMESAWGDSRFALEGNAFFGIHCYEDGCGMQIGDQKEYIKSYPDLQASVDDYMLFLNSKPGTENFRNTRQLYMKEQDMNALVESLDNYSESGAHYFNIINDFWVLCTFFIIKIF